jgi:hypothetical protein
MNDQTETDKKPSRRNARRRPYRTRSASEQRDEDRLDDELNMTFPASDPLSSVQPPSEHEGIDQTEKNKSRDRRQES